MGEITQNKIEKDQKYESNVKRHRKQNDKV